MLEFLKEKYPDRRVMVFGDYAYIFPDGSDDRDGKIFRGEDGRLAIHWTKPE